MTHFVNASYHDMKDSITGKSAIAIPFSVDKKFKFKNILRDAAKQLNNALEGLKFVEIRAEDAGFNPFKFGLLFVSDQKECFWTVGKSPGFEGSSKTTLRY